MSNSTLTLTQVHNIIRAHAAFDASDVNQLINKPNSIYGFTQKTLDACYQFNIDVEYALTFNQKALKRWVNMVNAIDAKSFAKFDKTHARLLIALRADKLTKGLNTDALTLLTANKRSTEKSVNLYGVSVDDINRVFKLGSHGITTVSTKISNMTGKNGWAQLMGVTWANPGEQLHGVFLNADHALTKAFFNVIDNATIDQLKSMVSAD